MKGRGCRKPDAAKHAAHPKATEHAAVKLRLASHQAKDGAPLPPSADKLPTPPTSSDGLDLDQGQSSSCTLAALSCGVWMALVAKGTPLPFVPSQRFGYALERALERAAATPQGEGLAALTDTGADLEDGFAAFARDGVIPMKAAKTPDGRFYDIWTDADVGPGQGNVNAEAEVLDFEVAGTTLVTLDVAAHTVTPTDAAALDTMCAALDASPPLPLIAAGLVDTAFARLQAGQVAQPADPNDPFAGGHAYLYTKYRTNAAGKREFFLKNSWGHWAEGNGVWCSEEEVRACWAIYVLDVNILERKAA